MNIRRRAYKYLLRWKENKPPKPLIIRGARQVGKTTLIREFGAEFDHFVELNLERSADKRIFEIGDVNKMIDAIAMLKGVVISNKSTLLFIDEIQELPKAIKMLRYFYEDRPDIYVVAAGSLLEFSLKSTANFPVGRVSYLYLHPVSFEEYIDSLANQALTNAFKTIPVPKYAHDKLLELFHEYMTIGGMPEILSKYLNHKTINQIITHYKDLWQSYKDDIEKYARNGTEQKILRHLIETAPLESDRIKFEQFGNSHYRSREVGEALYALDLAGIISIIYPTTNVAPPISKNLKKRPRLQFLDIGLYCNTLQLQGEMMMLKDMNDFQRGKVIQLAVNQELIATYENEKYRPTFWVREEKGTSSKVDLVIQYGKYLIPVEIKSGKHGRLRSLHQFMERTNHPYAVRIYADKFSIEKVSTPAGKDYYLMNLPYYLSANLSEYLRYFINATSKK